jgi:hypothetical protein
MQKARMAAKEKKEMKLQAARKCSPKRLLSFQRAGLRMLDGDIKKELI